MVACGGEPADAPAHAEPDGPAAPDPKPGVAPEPEPQPEPGTEPEPLAAPEPLPPDAPTTLGTSKHGELTITVESRRKTWLLGENIVLHYVVKNTGTKEAFIDEGGDYRGGARAQRILVRGVGPDGKPVDDPFPGGQNFGGLGGEHELKPGEEFVFHVPLARYLRLEAPGTYRLRVAHDLGDGAEVPEGDTRWVEGELEVLAPTPGQVQTVVANAKAMSSDSNRSVGKRAEPYADFTAMGYPAYLQPLRAIVDDEPRALQGIASIVTPEATGVLIDLAEHEDPERATEAMTLLASRLPLPPGMGAWDAERRKYLVDHAYDAATLGPRVRALGLKLLGEDDADRVAVGAGLLAIAVTSEDLPVVVEALDAALERTVREPIAFPEPRTPVSALLRTATALRAGGAAVPTDPKTPGEIAIYLSAHGASGSRPADYATRAAGWLTHEIPQVVVLTLRQTKGPLPDELVAGLGPLLEVEHLGVLNAACDALIDLDPQPALRPKVEALMRKTEDAWLLRCLDRAAPTVGLGRDEIVEIWASRLDEEPRSLELLQLIVYGIVDTNGGGSSSLKAGEAARLKKVWTEFLPEHRDRIRDGKKFAIGKAPLRADLFPPGFTMSDTSGKSWPPR